MILIQYLVQDIFKTDQVVIFKPLKLSAKKISLNLKPEFFAQDLLAKNAHFITLFS